MVADITRHVMVVILGMTVVLAQGGEKPVLRKGFEKKWTTDPTKADPRWEQAAKHRRYGELEEAIALYEKFLEENEDEISVLVSMGNAYWELGELDEAEAWLKKAKAHVPNHIKARQYLGQLLFQKGRFTEAKQEFTELIGLKWNRPDVVASGHLNLGRIALVQRDWRAASKHFFETGRSPEKGDRHSAKRGRFLAMQLRRSNLWSREKTKHLDIRFSPEVKAAKDPVKRKAWAQAREQAIVRICRELEVTYPERLAMYVFRDGVDCHTHTGQNELMTWRSFWWMVWTGWDRPPGYDLASQIVPRIRGNRPSSKPFVVGLCSYLDGTNKRPHAIARNLLKTGRLPSISAAHSSQRYPLIDALDKYGAESLVTFLVSTYGMKAFLKSFGSYDNVMKNAKWRVSSEGTFRWRDAVSAVLERGLGEEIGAVESKWHDFLRR